MNMIPVGHTITRLNAPSVIKGVFKIMLTLSAVSAEGIIIRKSEKFQKSKIIS